MSIQSSPLTFDKTISNGSQSWYRLISAILDPCLAVGVFFALTWRQYGMIRSNDVILAIVTFSLMYPSKAPFRRHARGWMNGVLFNWMLVFLLLLALGLATRTNGYFDPWLLLHWGAISPVCLLCAHYISPYALKRIAAMQRSKTVVIVGCTDLTKTLLDKLEVENLDGLKVIGLFDDRGTARLPESLSAKWKGNMDQLQEFAKTNPIDRIMITLPMSQNPRILKLLDDLRDTTASIYFVPDLFMVDLIQARMDSIGDLPILAVCESPFHGINGAVKRLSDIIIATVCLGIFSPLMLLTAMAVKVTSSGPIIFRQKRYGLDGKEIVVWKFRSMKNNPEQAITVDRNQIVQATQNDARVTLVGRFIRKTSLDELPQLINVLQGRMSVVGPRPHAVSQNEAYRSLIKGYMVRHKVKPGITGLAQINGARGETKTVDDMQRRIELDLRYLRNWSLRLDLTILMRTIRVLVYDPQAY
jgi:putative colanic acid biosysnthesis UDP-glucose lipid carrier transferase